MTETKRDSAPSRAVMVDVGPGFGALVVVLPASFLGTEIEISRKETPELRRHVSALSRTLTRGTATAAVFPSLPAGDHLLWTREGQRLGEATIEEARVQELDWSSPPSGDDLLQAAGGRGSNSAQPSWRI